jgi:hypothetical protein
MLPEKTDQIRFFLQQQLNQLLKSRTLTLNQLALRLLYSGQRHTHTQNRFENLIQLVVFD